MIHKTLFAILMTTVVVEAGPFRQRRDPTPEFTPSPTTDPSWSPTTSVSSDPYCVTTYYSTSGDTCVSIGSKYGLTDVDISQANSFINCYDIWTNTPVCIPPPGTTCGLSYTSVAGDSCATVGTRFAATPDQVSLWNWWVNCDNVWTGTVLCVAH